MYSSSVRRNIVRVALCAAVSAFSVPLSAVAGGSGSHEHNEHRSANEPEPESAHGHHQHKLEWGEPGRAGEVIRTIEVTMGDIYFKPEKIQAGEGETIRFIVRNVGNLVHEFNIGTNHMHQEHREEMVNMLKMGMMTATAIDHDKMEHGDMKHDDANSVLVEPGKSAELIWRFTEVRDLEFACNVPGHYEAGMVGVLSVEKTVSGALPPDNQTI